MRKNIISIMLSCLILILLCSITWAAVPVNVSVGKGTIVTLKEPSKRVSVSNPEIADMSLVSPSEILINGKKIGSTNMIVWDTTGKKTFFDILVSGDLSLLEAQIKDLLPGSDITAEMVGDTLILKGGIINEQSKKKVEQVAQAFAPKDAKIVNLMVMKDAQQVLLEVRVAQIDKTKLQQWGVSAIAGNIPGISSINPLNMYQIGISYFKSGVGIVLKALQEQGIAKVLAEPNMVVRSGEEGKFLVGTRVPIQVVTGAAGSQTVSIQYENVGIKLNFKPEVMDTGAIRLKIDPAEVSNIIQFISFANGITAPEIDTREIRTSVDLRDGESLILAGLLTEDTKKNIQKIPFFGDIPIFGALFRSTSDELAKKELAFFITPKLVKPIPAGVKTLLPGERAITPEEEKEFKWMPLGKQEN
ncbi:MAG: pilus assembly protein N-terminal domain-containing protein [Nitrospirae bacterium]|nr:pilus assembly protein N-terminal domain-containing protein [Nitrospirota bacterium]